jgi:hypothetical protein
MKKNDVQEGVLKKHEFSLDFQCQNEKPEIVKVKCLHHACCKLKGCVGHKYDETWVSKLHQKGGRIEPMGAHGRVF